MKEKIIIYQNEKEATQLEVRIEDETVWLTQAQMSSLFQTTRNNITLHIGNIFKEEELLENSVCKDSLLTASDGKNYSTKFYNLDVIISVGYRVKSKRGTEFRIWANKILKEYLLKGYAINKREEQVEKQVKYHGEQLEKLIQTALPLHEGIFYDGQIFDAYLFASKLIKTATTSIVLIDNYIDETVLQLLTKRKPNVKALIFTHKISEVLKLDIERHNKQYKPIEVKEFKKSHDRFLIIDKQKVFHIGASLKDLGNKWFAFSKINIDANEMINKLKN